MDAIEEEDGCNAIEDGCYRGCAIEDGCERDGCYRGWFAIEDGGYLL